MDGVYQGVLMAWAGDARVCASATGLTLGVGFAFRKLFGLVD